MYGVKQELQQPQAVSTGKIKEYNHTQLAEFNVGVYIKVPPYVFWWAWDLFSRL